MIKKTASPIAAKVIAAITKRIKNLPMNAIGGNAASINSK